MRRMENTAVGRHMATKKRDIIYACLLLAYILYNLSFLICHENWRDEAQAWLLARDLSIPELIAQMSYEGHPCLWHLLLMPLAKLGLPYVSMNVLSLTVMSVAVALFLWKAPLPLPFKALALFGGAFSYYYPVIARSYCLIPLFAFMMACFYPARREKPLRYGLSIALMVHTHIIMLGMAATASLVWLGEAIAGYRRDRGRRTLLMQGAGLTLPLLSFLFLLVQVSHPQNATAYNLQPTDVLRLPREAALAVRELFAPFPTPLNYILALLAVGVPLWFLIRAVRKREFALLKAAVAVAVGMAWQFVIHVLITSSTVMRTLSNFFMLLWFFWVSWPVAGDKWLRRLLALVLAAIELVTYSAYPLVFNEYRLPNSDAGHCAAFIEGTLPPDTLFLDLNEARAASLLPHLPEGYVFYSIYDGEPVTFASWDKAHYAHMALDSYEDICAWALGKDPACGGVCLIVTNTYEALELAFLDELAPYCTDGTLVYQSPDVPMNTDEWYKLYMLPVAGGAEGDTRIDG